MCELNEAGAMLRLNSPGGAHCDRMTEVDRPTAADSLGGATFVTMMKPSDFRNGDDLSDAAWLNWPGLRCILL